MPDDLFVLVPFFLAVNYVTVLCHELGHAVLASLAGYRVTACGLGLGRPITRVQIAGTVLYLCWRKPFQGLTFSQSTRSAHARSAEAILLSGGLLAHALLIAAALLLQYRTGHWTLSVVLWLNVAYLAIGLIPIRFRVGGALIESDALRIYRVFTARPSRTKLGTRRRVYAQCLDHLAAISDRVGVYAYSAEQAMLELECGQPDAAWALTAADPPRGTPAYLVGRQHLARGLAAALRGDEATSNAELARAESEFARDAGGRAMVEVARLELRMATPDDLETADLEAVAADAEALIGRDGVPGWAAEACRRVAGRALTRLGRFDDAAAHTEKLARHTWLHAWQRGMRAEAAADVATATAAYREALAELAPSLAGLPTDLRASYLDEREGLPARIRALGDPESVAELDALLDQQGETTERVESHLGVLAMYFVGTGLAINLGLFALLYGRMNPEFIRTLVTIAGTTSLAGFGAGLMAFFTRDRKRLALIAIALSVPACLMSLFFIGQLALLARG